MLFIDADASDRDCLFVIGGNRSALKICFVSDFRAVQVNINLAWRDAIYFIVNLYFMKLLTTPRTLENDRFRL